jgi:peroxiredoxin
VRQRHAEFRRLGAEVVVVTPSRPDVVAAFLRQRALPFPVIADPQRDAYRAFGLDRTSWLTIFRPDVLMRYVVFILRGWLPRKIRQGEDVLQLGGDFLLDGDGRLIYAYRSAEPTDRPAVKTLLQAVRDVAMKPPAAAG